ncbi:MAG: hypothetical protein LBL91_00430 [Lachnospiraceae bacterium]|nr:hypothetical protein [Lachnospiraceae bacterium]
MEETATVSMTETITNTINTLFSNMFSSIDNSLYGVLDEITFINSEIINNNFFKNILGQNSINNIIIICNSLLFGFVLYYLVTFLLSHLVYCKAEKPGQFVFKLLFCSILINSSFFICEKIIFLFSTTSLAIRSLGEGIFGYNMCFSYLIERLNLSTLFGGSTFNAFSMDGLIKGFISIGLLNLVFSYSLRYILVQVFILVYPFAILMLINSSTVWIFKAWIKNFLSLLFLQVFISIIFLIVFSLDFSLNDMFSKIIFVGGIYALIKANSILKEIIGGVSITTSASTSGLRSMITGGK